MTEKDRVMEFIKKRGVVRGCDVEKAGMARSHLYRLYREGAIQKLTRGVYAAVELPITEHIDLVEIAKRVPGAVISLISALSFHGITTQIPREVWVSLPRGAWRPKVDYPPLNVAFVSERSYSFAVEQHRINGVVVKVYSPAKTVADCFAFRNKVGLDVAIEALREIWRSRKVTVDELLEAARVMRMSKIMRPYLEAIV